MGVAGPGTHPRPPALRTAVRRARPFALVENGSRPEQRVVTGTAGRTCRNARVRTTCSRPALLIIGEVAALAGTLHWFGAPPLQRDLAADWPRRRNEHNPYSRCMPARTNLISRATPCTRPSEYPMTIYDSILDTIGSTPIVKLHRIAPKHVTLYAKDEVFNPGGSVKDRLALAIVLDAEQQGPAQARADDRRSDLRQHRHRVGDGRGGARLSVRRGDDRDLLDRTPQADARVTARKVILTPAAERGSGMVRKAQELADKHGWFLARQFENEANPAYHRSTTGPEILRDFAGKRLDYFVSGWGTGGTITGAGEVLKLARPGMKVIASEPAGAALLSGKEWQPHKIQGWTPDFLPAVLSRTIADEILPIDDVVARDTARRLAAEEGVFVGISAGATVAAALQVAEARAGRLGAAGDAARHRRALPLHLPVRRRQRGLGRRVAGLAGGRAGRRLTLPSPGNRAVHCAGPSYALRGTIAGPGSPRRVTALRWRLPFRAA